MRYGRHTPIVLYVSNRDVMHESIIDVTSPFKQDSVVDVEEDSRLFARYVNDIKRLRK